MLTPSRAIVLKPAGDGFVVEIVPPFTEGANFDQAHATYKAARGYGGGLRLVLGLPFRDLSGESDG